MPKDYLLAICGLYTCMVLLFIGWYRHANITMNK